MSDGSLLQIDRFKAPWGESLEAAWKLSAGMDSPDGDHAHDHGASGGGGASATAIDPVCGMTVDTASARGRDLNVEHLGATYYFCGKGCKLEFGDDPEKYLDPAYVPSM
jgi:Cu+-exporting ATPase